MSWLSRLVCRKPCDHAKNYVCTQWKHRDGTPMLTTVCMNCEYKDEGHVYTNDDDWPAKIQVFRNGELVLDL